MIFLHRNCQYSSTFRKKTLFQNRTETIFFESRDSSRLVCRVRSRQKMRTNYEATQKMGLTDTFLFCLTAFRFGCIWTPCKPTDRPKLFNIH